jgi:hypothetical protein
MRCLLVHGSVRARVRWTVTVGDEPSVARIAVERSHVQNLKLEDRLILYKLLENYFMKEVH